MNEKTRKTATNAFGTICMILIALILGGILVYLTGNSPFEAYGAMLRGAFSSPQRICELFVKLIPILLMAFGVSIAYKAQLWNIGAEGQFIMSSIAATAVALYINIPIPVRFILSFIASLAAGALYAGLAGYLRNRFGANEVITTMMLNSIASYFLMYLVNGPMQDPTTDLSQSPLVPESMFFARLIGNYRLHIGIFILLAVTIMMCFFWKSSVGYRINLIGQGEMVATYAGINVKQTVMTTMMISGAFAGLAGWIETFGIQHRILDGIAADYGNISTIIALLGSLNVYGIIASACFFSVLLCGGASMQRMTEVPYSVVNVIQGLIIILVIARNMFADRLPQVSHKEKKG